MTQPPQLAAALLFACVALLAGCSTSVLYGPPIEREVTMQAADPEMPFSHLAARFTPIAWSTPSSDEEATFPASDLANVRLTWLMARAYEDGGYTEPPGDALNVAMAAQFGVRCRSYKEPPSVQQEFVSPRRAFSDLVSIASASAPRKLRRGCRSDPYTGILDAEPETSIRFPILSTDAWVTAAEMIGLGCQRVAQDAAVCPGEFKVIRREVSRGSMTTDRITVTAGSATVYLSARGMPNLVYGTGSRQIFEGADAFEAQTAYDKSNPKL